MTTLTNHESLDRDAPTDFGGVSLCADEDVLLLLCVAGPDRVDALSLLQTMFDIAQSKGALLWFMIYGRGPVGQPTKVIQRPMHIEGFDRRKSRKSAIRLPVRDFPGTTTFMQLIVAASAGKNDNRLPWKQISMGGWNTTVLMATQSSASMFLPTPQLRFIAKREVLAAWHRFEEQRLLRATILSSPWSPAHPAYRVRL